MSSPAESSVRLKDDRGYKRKASSPAEKPSEECDLKQQHCERGVRYIEELAGLLSSNNLELWDFNLRPNKAAALRKVLGQIRSQEYQTEEKSISPVEKTWEREDLLMVRGCSEVLVRQLLDALGGFFFAVNEEGVMVFVSKNVRRYLRYEQEELLGSSVYSLLHVGDHAKFVRILLPKSLANSMSRPSSVQQQKHEDSSPGERSFTCRMLLNPPHEDDNRDVHKPEKPQAYIMMQCFAVPRPDALPEKVEVDLGDVLVMYRFWNGSVHFSCFPQSCPGLDPHKCLMCVVRPLDVARAAQQSFGSKQDLKGAAAPTATMLDDESCNPVSRTICEDQTTRRFGRNLKFVQGTAVLRGGAQSPVYTIRVADKSMVASQPHSRLLRNPNAQQPHDITSADHSMARDHANRHYTPLGQSRNGEPAHMWSQVHSPGLHCQPAPAHGCVSLSEARNSSGQGQCECDEQLQSSTNVGSSNSPLDVPPRDIFVTSPPTSHSLSPFTSRPALIEATNQPPASSPLNPTPHTVSCFNSCSTSHLFTPGSWSIQHRPLENTLSSSEPILQLISSHTIPTPIASPGHCASAVSNATHDLQTTCPPLIEPSPDTDQVHLLSDSLSTHAASRDNTDVEVFAPCQTNNVATEELTSDDTRCLESWTQVTGNEIKSPGVVEKVVVSEAGVRGSDGQHADDRKRIQLLKHFAKGSAVEANTVKPERGAQEVIMAQVCAHTGPSFSIKYNEQNEDGIPQPFEELRMHQSWPTVNNVEKFEHRVASTDGVWDFQSSGTSTRNELKLEPPAANADNILYLQRSVACNTVDVKKGHDGCHDIGMYSFTVAPQHSTNAMAGPPESVGPQPDVQVVNNLDFWIYDSGYVRSPCNAQAHMDEPTYTSSRHDEKFLLDQLNTLLNSTNDLDLAEIDKALGIDMLMQTGVPHTAAGALPSAVYGHPYNRGTVSVPYSGAFVSQPSHLSNAASMAQHGLYMTQGIHLGGIPSHSAAPQLLGAPQGQISPNQLQLQLQQRLQSPQQAPMNVQAMMQQRREMLRRKQHPQHNMRMKQTLACGVPPNSTVPSGFLLSSSDSSTQLYMHPITNTVTAGAPHPVTQFSPISPNLIIQQGNSGMIQQQTARVEMGPATCSYEHVRGNSLEQNNLQFPTTDMTHQSDPAYGGQGPLASLGMSHLRRSALTDFRPISPDLGWQPIPGVTNTPNAQNRGCVSRPQHMVTPGMYVHPTAGSRPSECIEPPGMQVVRMGTEQQVEVYADVQCTVNLLENDSYLCQPPGGLACVTQPVVSMPGHVQGSSLLQQLLTE